MLDLTACDAGAIEIFGRAARQPLARRHLAYLPERFVPPHYLLFFFSSRRRHTILTCDWSSDVCSSDLDGRIVPGIAVYNSPPAQAAAKIRDAVAIGYPALAIYSYDSVWARTGYWAVLRPRRRCARICATSPSSPTWTTAKRRSWTACCGRAAFSGRTSRWSSACSIPTISSARRESRSSPRTRRSGGASARSTSSTRQIGRASC